MVIDRGALVEEIVGADDRSVAPGIAAADPALLEYRDVRHAVQLGEVVSCRQPVPAAADDERVIARLRIRHAPRRLPGGMAAKPFADQRDDVVALHPTRLGARVT